MRGQVRALAAALLIGCFTPALDVSERRGRAAALLAEPLVTVVYDSRAHFAVVTPRDALTLSSGFEQGEALSSRFGLESPARALAQALAADLHAQPRFAGTEFRVAALGDLQDELATRGAAPVLAASVAEWRLVYDLSLSRYRLVLGLWASIAPAWMVASGRGSMALPERLWRGACTSRGPDPTLPLDAWLADDGAVLRARLDEAVERCGRALAGRLARFVDAGEEQSAFDFGELEPTPSE